MVVHYLRLALKTISKHKYYAVINVLGLVCGMLSMLIIGNYIAASLAFDNFHVKREQIHFVVLQESTPHNELAEIPATYQGVASMLDQFPEVTAVTRYNRHVEALVIAKAGDKDPESHVENRIFISDSAFFRIFTFSFTHGNSLTALSRQNTLVLTESAALKYFGSSDALGNIMTIRTSWGQETSYEVVGVVADVPPLSRFQFDFLIRTSEPHPDEMWHFPDHLVFALVRENADIVELEKKVTAQVGNVAELKSANKTVIVGLNSFAESSLTPTENLLLIVGVTIGIICWANYINQTIAQAFWRLKQISVQKVLGASKTNQATQFAAEALIICTTSLLFVFVIYISLENWLTLLTNGHLLSLTGSGHQINLMILSIFAAGASVATVAPTLVVFRQRLEQSLRSSFIPGVGGIAVRKLFVVIQFSITTLLVVGIFVIARQLEFLTTKEKGFNIENILVVKAPMAKDTTWRAKLKTLQLFKQEVAQLPFVTEVSSSTTVPGEEYRQETYLSLQGDEQKIMVHQNGVDENFFTLYGMSFVAGHDFIPDARAKNAESIILNESALNAIGFSAPEDAIHAKLIDHENPEVSYEVIGVVKDYHQTSLKYQIRPLAFKYNLFRGHCSIKLDESFIAQGNFDNTSTSLLQIWKKTYPDAAFDIFFLEERFRSQDEQDQQFGMIFKSFTILSVVLSCFGLFGLSVLISVKRQKEVGVRKTFGANVFDIVTLFLKGYIPQLCIALALGSTGAFFLMNSWLANYANRISVGADLILSAVLTLVVIFIGTVSFHTIKSARTNPVNVLRSDS